jgi:hypothetical protein
MQYSRTLFIRVAGAVEDLSTTGVICKGPNACQGAHPYGATGAGATIGPAPNHNETRRFPPLRTGIPLEQEASMTRPSGPAATDMHVYSNVGPWAIRQRSSMGIGGPSVGMFRSIRRAVAGIPGTFREGL